MSDNLTSWRLAELLNRFGPAIDELAICKGFGLPPPHPSTPAGRLHVAMALIAPTCVDEDGNEYTGEPLIDAEGFRRILEGA